MSAKDLISHISGGKVLDVATGNGNFIHFLIESLMDYDEITSIDIKDGLEIVFETNFKNHPVSFEKMDAANLQFSDASFDTVCISNSLHHMPELERTLKEMLRVLKPGGYFFISEMYRNNQSPTQMTHVQLHHWWAAVDRSQGIFHGDTLRREEIIQTAASLGFVEMQMQDLFEMNENPHDPKILAELEPVIERYIQRAEDNPELQIRGKELLKLLKDVGFDGATVLFIISRKGIDNI